MVELLNRSPKKTALEMADWLDRLKPTWTKMATLAMPDELEWWLRKELSLQCSEIYLPFPVPFTSAIAIPGTPVVSADILAISTITAYVERCHGLPDPIDPRAFSVETFRTLHRDRCRCIRDGVDAGEVQRITTEKRDASIARDARCLLPSLRESSRDIQETDVVQAAERLRNQTSALPLDRLNYNILRWIGEVITEKKSTSGQFEQLYRSLGWDLEHLSGAAYCDVFTCDHFIDKAIGTFRTDLGFRRQISVGGAGGPGAFVAELEAQCAWELIQGSG
jgi:hypothetical protein